MTIRLYGGWSVDAQAPAPYSGVLYAVDYPEDSSPREESGIPPLRLTSYSGRLAGGDPAARATFLSPVGLKRLSRSATHYTTQVQHLRHRILAGDLFQANLSREITVDLPGATRADVTGFAERLFARERPAFGAIIQHPGQTIISASPERFFRAEPTPAGTKITAEPIKGTRPRSTDPTEDARLAAELQASEKDRAENVMIADLVRNDLSKVCTDDSVHVERLCELRSFPKVHHLVTTVTGILRPGVTIEDAFWAQFPCGSITGAPKLAAMDLIAELEQRDRGIYCGAIGYITDDGYADFSVAIRTATVDYHADGATMRFGVGGGVTALSDPEAEYQETVDKARVFLDALEREAAAAA